jgi:hypothetical protein
MISASETGDFSIFDAFALTADPPAGAAAGFFAAGFGGGAGGALGGGAFPAVVLPGAAFAGAPFTSGFPASRATGLAGDDGLNADLAGGALRSRPPADLFGIFAIGAGRME